MTKGLISFSRNWETSLILRALIRTSALKSRIKLQPRPKRKPPDPRPAVSADRNAGAGKLLLPYPPTSRGQGSRGGSQVGPGTAPQRAARRPHPLLRAPPPGSSPQRGQVGPSPPPRPSGGALPGRQRRRCGSRLGSGSSQRCPPRATGQRRGSPFLPLRACVRATAPGNKGAERGAAPGVSVASARRGLSRSAICSARQRPSASPSLPPSSHRAPPAAAASGSGVPRSCSATPDPRVGRQRASRPSRGCPRVGGREAGCLAGAALPEGKRRGARWLRWPGRSVSPGVGRGPGSTRAAAPRSRGWGCGPAVTAFVAGIWRSVGFNRAELRHPSPLIRLAARPCVRLPPPVTALRVALRARSR